MNVIDKGIQRIFFLRAKLLYIGTPNNSYFNTLSANFLYIYYKIFKSSRIFIFQNRSYHYFYHMYNYTWMAERTVEVPIVWEYVKKNKGKKILEVGNVLSHYFHVTHDILDKYEKGRRVINQDVVLFNPKMRYDLIISISTLEHVGWDDYPRDPNKIPLAIKKLFGLLAPKGELVVTLPIGQNPYLDTLLNKKALPFTSMYYLKRVTADNVWEQTDWKVVKDMKYSYPYMCANGIIIGIIKKS
jgi:hypothetical protein